MSTRRRPWPTRRGSVQRSTSAPTRAVLRVRCRTGAVRWSHDDGDRISGSATIVNNVVYYSDLDDKRTTGLNTRTGAVEFTFHDGAYSPIVGDPNTLFLSGHNVLYELTPKKHSSSSAHPTRSSHHQSG